MTRNSGHIHFFMPTVFVQCHGVDRDTPDLTMNRTQTEAVTDHSVTVRDNGEKRAYIASF
jgi:hypothetical protein